MIYVLLVDGFEEIEAIEPIDIMRRAGLSVKTVGVSSKLVTGSHNITVTADIEINEVDSTDMELLMLPGGPGYVNLVESEAAQELIKTAAEKDFYIASICAAPSVVGRLGLLKGKKATCFPGYEEYLIGAEVLSDKAVADGKFITGKGAGAAAEFGFLIVELLCGEDKAAELRGAMQY